MRWAEGGSCRHDAILRYFGDEEETLSGCGRCDVCMAIAEGGEQDPETVSLTVRKALSAVARTNGRFGIQVAANLLRGSPGMKDCPGVVSISHRPSAPWRGDPRNGCLNSCAAASPRAG